MVGATFMLFRVDDSFAYCCDDWISAALDFRTVGIRAARIEEAIPAYSASNLDQSRG